MLSWLFEILTSIITFILGLFGIDYKSKTVSFSDDEKNDESTVTNTVATAEVTETKTEEESTKSE